MAELAADCAARVARLLGLSQTELVGLKLAAEDAFLDAVAQYPGKVGCGERIRMEYSLVGEELVVRVRDKGIPFGRDVPPQADVDTAAAQAAQKFMDTVESVVHGREGRELRMTKRLGGALKAGVLMARRTAGKTPRKTVKDPVIRVVRRADDLVRISRLAWRCYGYTHEELLYDPRAMAEMMTRGEYASVIAIVPETGRIIGHIGLKYHAAAPRVPELGLAFVDPDFRSPGMPKRMAKMLFDAARENGARGIFDCSVTTHTFSQKGMHEMGSRPCCLMLGIAALGMQAKELATTRQDKGSVVNHYYAFDRTPEAIFVPERHHGMVAEIYQWLELPRTLVCPADVEEASGAGASRVSTVDLPDALNVSFIEVHTIGGDAAQEVGARLARCRRAGKAAVFVFVPTAHPSAPALVEQCEAMGLSFCGVMPHIHDGGDRLLLQYVDTPIDVSAIRVYGDMSRDLLAYVKAEYERASALR